MKSLTFTSILILLVVFFSSVNSLTAQVWQQTASTPEGGGVTELIVADNGYLFVSTASTSAWPSGDQGGVRRSTDGGETWENLIDAYTGRYIMQGDDGYIYAVAWPYPSDESLYRTSDYGDTWEFVTSVSQGNNIFSVAVNTTTIPTTIFAGTGQGVLRSTANGAFFDYSNEGIDEGAWILCMDVNDDGIVAAGTTSGYYVSNDNGESWTKGEGAVDSDTITALQFYTAPAAASKSNGQNSLTMGTRISGEAQLVEAFYDSEYLTSALLTIFGPAEISSIFLGHLQALNTKLHGVATFPMGSFGGGYYQSTDEGETFEEITEGLPENPPIASIDAQNESNKNSGFETLSIYAGLYQGMNGGAKVYHLVQDLVKIDENLHPGEEIGLVLHPNPFLQKISIDFHAQEDAQVSLAIYNSMGNLVHFEKDRHYAAGSQSLKWDSEGLAAGVYYYVLTVGVQNYTGKLLKN